ncbi:hypothetical protein SLEP1_g3804 [Rubroshorea leprosula]|uniref:Uncharacterized protein n=1 Tax=Rubroshorea leprosula TaxID=152421 RepID=A0AAV5HU93_9ROSI|nr:hypothetical protein SLEP1_g3804 [Rubroshorea leprosula]
MRAVPTQQQLPSLSQPPTQQQLSSLTQLPTQLQQEQPTVTQPPLNDDQHTSDDATMEEDTEECNLEAELDGEFVVLDPELDAQLEEELSRAVPKTGRGMDKGDDAPADPSQRKRTYYWEEDDVRVYKIWRLHCWNRFRDELHRARKAWVKDKKLPEFMHRIPLKFCWQNGGVQNILHSRKEVDKIEQKNDAHQKYVEKHGPNKDSWPEWDPLIWKEVVGPPKKGFLQHKSSSCSLSLLKFRKKWLGEFRQRWPHVFIQRYHREYQRWRPALRGDSKSTCAYLASNIL